MEGSTFGGFIRLYGLLKQKLMAFCYPKGCYSAVQRSPFPLEDRNTITAGSLSYYGRKGYTESACTFRLFSSPVPLLKSLYATRGLIVVNRHSHMFCNQVLLQRKEKDP
jgi:hypothetical protein